MFIFIANYFFRAYSRTVYFYVCRIPLTFENKGGSRLITEAALDLIIHRFSPLEHLKFKKEIVKYRTYATLDSVVIMYTCVICIAMSIAAL